MIRTFGQMPKKKPEGMGARIHFPVLARMDTETDDHRLLDSGGGDTRDLPLSIRAQFASTYGHDGALVTGALHQISFDPETGIISGDGFLLDDDNGRRHALYVKTGSMRGNSIDLTKAKARFEEDLDGPEYAYRIRFTEWTIGATTGVGTPAFADARAEIVADDAEIIASFFDGDEVLISDAVDFSINILPSPAVAEEIPEELLASGIVQPYEFFFRPETETPTKIVVDANGHVYGHLGMWDSCHDGIEGQCVRIPRPADNYASYNKPGVLTDRGIVETGPIFAYGGHRPGKGVADLAQAYGGIENAWADVRITAGRLGPWISGVTRPGVPDEAVYAARASRISGHWLNGRLKAIVSVNAEGYDVPGSGEDPMWDDLAAGFAFSINDQGVSELIAGFPPCMATATTDPVVEPAVETEPAATEAASATDELLQVRANAAVLALLLEDDD
jgi:hypothetical protein